MFGQCHKAVIHYQIPMHASYAILFPLWVGKSSVMLPSLNL